MYSLLFVLLLALLSPLVITQRTSCPLPNQFFQNGICKVCRAGFFRGANRCIPCSKGTFRSQPGAGSFEQCISCPMNTFQDEDGKKACKPCPRGKFAFGRGEICVSSCPPGKDYSFRVCFNCSSGFFKPTRSFKPCQRCPDGTFTEGQGASQCTSCPPGQFKANSAGDFDTQSFFGGNGCTECQQGTYTDKPGTKFCKLCRFGFVSDEGATSCQKCPPGMFNGQLLARKCRPCKSGTVADKAGAAACKKNNKCPRGTFEDENRVCMKCLAGERLDKTMKKCILCGEDEISFGGVDTQCTACPEGKQPIGGASILERGDCVCKPGTVNDGGGGCIPCQPGTFWENQAVNFFQRNKRPELDIDGECVPCDAGEFSDTLGSFRCKSCPKDTFSENPGATSCKPCPTGFGSLLFRDEDRARCVEKNFVCGLGEIRAKVRETNRFDSCTDFNCCLATSCASGKFLPLGQRRCISCKPGYRYVPSFNNCFACPTDSVSNGGLDETCRRCDVVFKPNSIFDVGAQRCVCRDGFGGPNCNACGPGTRRVISLTGEATCLGCPEGEVLNGVNCEKCPNGRVTRSGGICVKCPGGTRQVRDIFRQLRNACRPRM